MEPGKVTGGVEGFVDVNRPSPLPVCGYSVSRRLIRHAVDNTLCALFGLLLSPLRWLLDLIGLPRPLRYSLYGVAVFLAAVYGLSLITLALRTYLVQATVAFAAFHCFVLAASLRHA